MVNVERQSRRGQLAAAISSGTVIVLAGFSAGCAAHPVGPSAHRGLTRHQSAVHTAARRAIGHARADARARARVKGAIAPGVLSCTGRGPAIGAVGVLRSGEATHAQQALGTDLVAQAKDSTSGQLMFFTPDAFGRKLSTYFSKIDFVPAHAGNSELHSCDMMLSDVPAAQPVITAAEQAVVGAKLVPSLSGLADELQEVLISDNVLRAGSLIVTLQVTGTERAPIYSGAPPTFSLAAFTVVMNFPSNKVTAVMKGGL